MNLTTVGTTFYLSSPHLVQNLGDGAGQLVGSPDDHSRNHPRNRNSGSAATPALLNLPLATKFTLDTIPKDKPKEHWHLEYGYLYPYFWYFLIFSIHILAYSVAWEYTHMHTFFLNIIWFTLFLFGGLALYALFMVRNTDPGFIPKYNNPPTTTDMNINLFCATCNIYPKPLRSKHCRTCDRCVLKFDHHCPFLDKCIGLYNYKYFMLFLTAMAINTLCGTILSFYDWRIAPDYWINTWPSYIFYSRTFASLFGMGLGSCLFIFFMTMVIPGWTLMAINLTTNEHINWKKYKHVTRRARDIMTEGWGYEYKCMYNKGLANNWLVFLNMRKENYDPFDSAYDEWRMSQPITIRDENV